MGILDVQAMFSDAQVLAATGNSTNTIDRTAAANMGGGMRLVLDITAMQTAAQIDGTLQAKLVGADDNAFGVNKITVADTGVVALPVQGLGVKLQAAIRSHKKKEFYRVEYTIAGTTPSFTITAAFAADQQTTPEVLTY